MTETAERPLRLPPAYRLVRLESVGSSNDEARRLAEEGAEEGTLVWVGEQTAGRGRQGRDWSSPPGNLYFSLILRPDGSAAEAATLGIAAALALGEAIGKVMPPLTEVHYKWPNDVLVNGRKISGILLEAKIAGSGAPDWLILGVGVNVESCPAETRIPATSLKREGAPRELTPGVLLDAFARAFLVWVTQWREEGMAPLRRAWLAHAAGLGETITVRLPKETLVGRFLDMDETGALRLGLEDGGERAITAGDVFFGAD